MKPYLSGPCVLKAGTQGATCHEEISTTAAHCHECIVSNKNTSPMHTAGQRRAAKPLQATAKKYCSPGMDALGSKLTFAALVITMVCGRIMLSLLSFLLMLSLRLLLLVLSLLSVLLMLSLLLVLLMLSSCQVCEARPAHQASTRWQLVSSGKSTVPPCSITTKSWRGPQCLRPPPRRRLQCSDCRADGEPQHHHSSSMNSLNTWKLFSFARKDSGIFVSVYAARQQKHMCTRRETRRSTCLACTTRRR